MEHSPHTLAGLAKSSELHSHFKEGLVLDILDIRDHKTAGSVHGDTNIMTRDKYASLLTSKEESSRREGVLRGFGHLFLFDDKQHIIDV